MTIENKIVAITGAGRGIGKATALHLAARGARLVLGARRKEEIAAVAEVVSASGSEAIYLRTDVTRRANLDALVSLACECFGRLDVIVINAGIGPLSRFDALKEVVHDEFVAAFFPLCSLQSLVLEEGIGNNRHKSVSVRPWPATGKNQSDIMGIDLLILVNADRPDEAAATRSLAGEGVSP